MQRLLLVCLLALIATASWSAAGEPAAPPPRKPAILFCSPGPIRYEAVGFDYMRMLAARGFEVDYIEGSGELTWDRARHFNVLVVIAFPQRDKGGQAFLFAPQPPWLDEYFGVVDRFVKAGGGVLLHYTNAGWAPNDKLKEWGIQFPLSYLRDPGARGMTNLSRGGLSAYTTNILPSPVSDGVGGIWYPIEPHYAGAHTMPVLIDANWTPVVKAAPSTYTVVPTFERGGWQPPADALIPPEPIKDPVLFAVREFAGGGRMAAIQQWFQFTIGSGMKWLYDGEILSKGLAGRRSDYGRLLLNTYVWLAQPSLASGALGGYATDRERLTEPQLRPGAVERLASWARHEEDVLGYRHPPVRGKICRGLIGAQTALSGAAGTVADYARAASESGLDFVVFLEDFARLTPEKLEALKAEVEKARTPALNLFAGYRIKANTGNHMFIFGMNPPWPEERVLTGPDKRTLNLQYQNEKGEWARGNPALDWCLNVNKPDRQCNIGYYRFAASPNGLQMYDLRAFSAAALRTYEDGKLVDDRMSGGLDDYLTTCQSFAVPSPMVVNIVTSPDHLRRAAAGGEALTYGQARALDTVYQDALRWSHSYDGLNVFASDGPIIRAWPRNVRVFTFGAESFVPERSLNVAPIDVASDAGLKEIRIYNGRELFRRFLPGGAKTFQTTLYLSGVVQRSMVLVADDVKGGRAVSFALRSYKEGSRCPVFCGDHVNDCGYMLLAHGPVWPSFFAVPVVPQAGGTWDGGPLAARTLCNNEFTAPGIQTSLGAMDVTPYQIPLLEFSDEGATRCRMTSDRRLIPELEAMSFNPWSGFGPLVPNELLSVWGSHSYYAQYAMGVDPNSYGATGLLGGPIAGLYSMQITFKKDLVLDRLRLWHSGWRVLDPELSVLLVTGKGAAIEDVLDLSRPPTARRQFRIPTGGWFGFLSAGPSNTHLFINRGGPVVLDAEPPGGRWLQLYADLSKQPFKAGDVYAAEFFNITWPMDQKIVTARELAGAVAYLAAPAGLKLPRGTRVEGPGGLLELAPKDGAVELSLPSAARTPGMPFPPTLPLRIGPFNPRWSVGLYQIEGYRTHYYSKGNQGWTELGLDFEHRAQVPVHVSRPPDTHMLIGHPVVADEAGKDLFIQATRINDGEGGKPPLWHVSVNNPLDRPVTAVVRQAMVVPGLEIPELTLTLQPGEYRVLAPVEPETKK